jgi:hypothetical protein
LLSLKTDHAKYTALFIHLFEETGTVVHLNLPCALPWHVRVCLQNVKQIDWTNYWNPRLYVDNCTGRLNETVWYAVMFNAEMEAYVFERRRVTGTFVEYLELNQFPFDTQVCAVRLHDALHSDDKI